MALSQEQRLDFAIRLLVASYIEGDLNDVRRVERDFPELMQILERLSQKIDMGESHIAPAAANVRTRESNVRVSE